MAPKQRSARSTVVLTIKRAFRNIDGLWPLSLMMVPWVAMNHAFSLWSNSQLAHLSGVSNCLVAALCILLWSGANILCGVMGVAMGTFAVRNISSGERPNIRQAWRDTRPLLGSLTRLSANYLGRQVLMLTIGVALVAIPGLLFILGRGVAALEPLAFPMVCGALAASILLLMLLLWAIVVLVTDFFWAPVFMCVTQATVKQSRTSASHQARGRRWYILSALGWLTLPQILAFFALLAHNITGLQGQTLMLPENWPLLLVHLDSWWWQGSAAFLSVLLAPVAWMLPATLAAEGLPPSAPTTSAPALNRL